MGFSFNYHILFTSIHSARGDYHKYWLITYEKRISGWYKYLSFSPFPLFLAVFSAAHWQLLQISQKKKFGWLALCPWRLTHSVDRERLLRRCLHYQNKPKNHMVVSIRENNKIQWGITRVYRREYIPFPGPPVENDPPPPKRVCKTVTANESFSFLQPPGTSNASATWVFGESAACLQSPPTYSLCTGAGCGTGGKSASKGSATESSSEWSTPEAASTILGAV